MTLIEFPLGLSGRVFGSPMPFGHYDQEGRLLDALKVQNIAVLVVLAEAHEYEEQTQRDLPKLYAANGFEVIHVPIPNYGVPHPEPLAAAVTKTVQYAEKSKSVLIHCSAGIGRTALFAVFLAMRVLKLTGRQAITWVGEKHPRALLTPLQITMILDSSDECSANGGHTAIASTLPNPRMTGPFS